MALTFRGLDGAVIPSGWLHNLFPQVRSGSGTAYAYVQVINETAGSYTAQKAFMAIDPAGCAVSIGVAEGTARAGGYSYSPSLPGSWSTATTYAAGLTLPDLAAGQKCLLAVKRDSAAATEAYPENNSLIVQSSGSI